MVSTYGQRVPSSSGKDQACAKALSAAARKCRTFSLSMGGVTGTGGPAGAIGGTGAAAAGPEYPPGGFLGGRS